MKLSSKFTVCLFSLFCTMGSMVLSAEGMPPLKGLEVLDEEPPQRMNPQEVAELINHRGKGTYWTDRSLHAYHNRYGRMADTRFDWVEEPVWGQSVSIPAGQEWEEHTLPPMSVIHGRPPSMNAGVVLHGLQNMANYEMVEPGDRARWVHAVLSAELFDTDLALDLADAWMRSAGPTDELLEAYMRRTMVLANAGRLDEIEEIPGPLKTDEAGHRSPWMEEIFISRDKWYRWGRNYSDTQKSWQAFRLALALGETGKARETWKAFNEHMEEGNPREKDREWWEESRGHWEAALKRLDEGMNWELSREDIAAVQLWRQFLKGWTYGDFAEQLADFSDDELFELIDAAEHLFGPWSMEYADLLLYAVEQRGAWSLDWDTESLMRVSHGMIRSIYHRQRPVPIYYLISQVMAHRPVPTDEREARLHYERRMGSLSAIVAATHGIRLNKAAQEKLYLMLLEEYQEMLGVVYELPKGLTFRAVAFQNYYLMDHALGLIEYNYDFWIYLLRNEPRKRLRTFLSRALRHYHQGDVDKQLEIHKIAVVNNPFPKREAERMFDNIVRRAFHLTKAETAEEIQAVRGYYDSVVAEFRSKHPNINIPFDEIYEKHAP